MWIQQASASTLTWKYGIISITKQSYQPNFNDITIACNPFKAEGPKCLYLDIRSQQDKSMQTVNKILQFFVEQRVVRKTRIVLKGGGLLLDVGGFACAIYMRGISNVTYMPTTLLAMVDATVGGKTGINFGSAKNIIGTVRHPKHIIIDISTLDSLSDREFFNGMAEVIKMAITYDSEFFQYLEKLDLRSLRKPQNKDKLQYIVQKSLEIKIRVVQKDQFEMHERKWLNFGHTIGHGIQLASGHNLLHGECVAIGMMKILQISAQLLQFNRRDVISRLKKLLQSINLPVDIPQGVDLSEMVNLMLKDKKKSDSSNDIEIVMIKDIGCPEDKIAKISIDQIKSYFSKSIQIQSFNKLDENVNEKFSFPSSKSISLRFAYMSALSVLKFNKPVTVLNFLQSDDTKWMLLSLKSIGFQIDHIESLKKLVIKKYIQKDSGILNIGNSGVTARLILPLCASLKGQWRIQCHSRMSERPNKQIIKLCQDQFDCQFQYLHKQYSFPLILKVKQTNFGLKKKSLSIDGNQSSQFITSIMIYGSFFHQQTQILTHKGTLVSQSYLEMTAQCLNYLGVSTSFEIGKIKMTSRQVQYVCQLNVQTDLSSLSYPYVFSLLHNLKLPSLPAVSMQGDLLFYQYLKQICVSRERQVRFDFNNCTDTFMTFAVFIVSPLIQNSGIRSITIHNIANQRVKESNRIHLIIKNLRKVGIKVEQYENQIKIMTSYIISEDDQFVFETANDHRLAMSLSILSTYLKKAYPSKSFIIDDKKAVQKTFPEFWSYLNEAGVPTSSRINQKSLPQSPKMKSMILIGDRGSGKTTMGRLLAAEYGMTFIDLDEKITEELQNIGYKSISAYVEKYGWKAFREAQSRLLQQFLGSKRSNKFLLATGAGIIENNLNCNTLSRDQSLKIYLQRDFDDLRIEQTLHRPDIGNYRQISKKRARFYQELASIIINIPERMTVESQLSLITNGIRRFLNDKPLKEGIIVSVNDIPRSIQQINVDPSDLSSIQLRLDSLIETGIDLKSLRRRISQFQKNSNIDTLLTLRTKDELGSFTGDYLSMQSCISKMPTQFLDHQFAFSINYNYNPSKMILSYHGQNQSNINKLVNLKNFNGIKKLCFKGSHNKWDYYFHKLGSRSICMNLDDPISRLHNKFQFAVLSESPNNLTGIMTVAQMKALNSFRKVLFKK